MDDLRERFIELDDLTDGVLGADVAGDPIALTFLLRRYRATGRDDLTETLGAALARAVEAARAAADADARAQWLELFVTAAMLSSDRRMRLAIDELVAAMRSAWGSAADVADVFTSVDACLQAAAVVESADLVRDAIDQLEQAVAGTYRPGHGMASAVGAGDESPRRLVVQLRGAAALVTACVGTARLPYGMLAEELVQFARRAFWDSAAGAFVDARGSGDAFATNCEAARVLCRLARLLRNDDYRLGAVTAETNGGADYLADASRILSSQLGAARADAARAAPYALALDDWLSLR